MKKAIAFLLSAILTFSLCACSNASMPTTDAPAGETDVKAKVINNNGVTENLTAKELCDLSDANPVSFKNTYWCAKVTVTGKVKEIGGLRSINGTYYNWTLEVEGGECDWFIGDKKYNTSTISEDLIASLSKGDTVEISGEIVGASFDEVDISNGTISVKKK